MRRVLAVVTGLVLLVCGLAGVGAYALWNGTSLDTTGEVDFTRKLAVPPLAPSRLDETGRRVFDLTAAKGSHDFGDGAVPTWGFNGSYLGPTLRAARGEQVVVNLRNQLGEPTTVHWHGMHLPAKMDGGPHQMVAAGQTWSPTWKIAQPAATLWYHPHLHGQTATHVYRGLAGLFLLDDGQTKLPHAYGVDDIPIVVQDKQFDGNRLDESRAVLGDIGILGDTTVVNGVIGPYLDVTTELVRLRLLNGANARIYRFEFADRRDFQLVGTDGGLLENPYTTKGIQLAPGERAEIVVALRAGERAVLRSGPQDLGIGALGDRFVGGHDRLDILELRAAPTLSRSDPVPAQLAQIERLDPKQATESRQFRLASRTINGRRMAMDRLDAVVQKGSTEIWTVTNNDGTPHSFHIHDVQFQVLRVGGAGPPPQLRGWKDTVFLRSGDPVQLIVRFTDYSDPNTPYMFHCHLLLHEDDGMMGQFVVVEPGQQPGPVHRH